MRFEIRNAWPKEFEKIGMLLVEVYSQLQGFPTTLEQPEYYQMLQNVGSFTQKESVELIVAVSEENKVVGAVVYFSDLNDYGSGGAITQIKNASGFRLLAVDPKVRGKGIGKMLSKACIHRAKALDQRQLFIHSTESMKIAWGMYERLGFQRCPDIDFIQGALPVFGFKLELE